MVSRWFPRPCFFQSLHLSQYTLAVRTEFLTSSSFQIVNPRHHRTGTDTVSQVFPESVVSGLNDEEILALFTRGFFGGFIFGLERTALRIGGWKLLPARFTGLNDDPNAVQIWKSTQLSSLTIPATGSCLFGSFKILDKQIPQISSESPASCVDFGFGSDESEFSGCHRFQITRLLSTKNQPLVQLELQGFHCNPQKDQPIWKPIVWFHYLYAKVLFANAVQSVLLR